MWSRFRGLGLAISLLTSSPAALAQSPVLTRYNPQSFVDFLGTRGLVASEPIDTGFKEFISEVYTPEEVAMQKGPNPITEHIGFALNLVNGKCKKTSCWFVSMRTTELLVDNSLLPKDEVIHWNATHKNSIMSNLDKLELDIQIPLVNGRIDRVIFDRYLLAWLKDFDEFNRKYYRPDPGVTRWPFMRVRVEPVPSYVDAYMRSLKSK